MSGLIYKHALHRRRLTAEQKMIIVQASYEPGVLVAEIARKHNVGISTLIKWRKKVMEGGLMSVKDDAPAISASEAKKLKKEIKQLQRLLGKKTLQVELLQEAVAIGREKKLISLQPLPGVDDLASE